MNDVMQAVGVFFSYAVLAVFAQNAVFTRGLGVSRLVQLVGDERTSSGWFALLLCVTQVLVAPLAFYAGGFIAAQPNPAQLRPLVFLACVAVVSLFEFIVLWTARGKRHGGQLLRILPLAAVNSGIRAALGALFTWKAAVLLTVIVCSVLFYRPFCKWLCPLGAFYALMNKVSLFGIKVDEHKCVSCGKCAGACKMDVDITKTPDHAECIRCGKCISVCPTEAVSFRYGFNLPKTLSSGNEKPKNDKKSK